MVIIGKGEIGRAIGEVIGDAKYIDINYRDNIDKADVIHICFPYSNDFKSEVIRYNAELRPQAVIIHSTVRPGTCESLQMSNLIYSPVRGRHKTLASHIREFVKYYYCIDKEGLFLEVFNMLKCRRAPDYRSLEIAKIMSTTYMYWGLVYQRYLYKYCQESNTDFDFIYGEWQRTYNDQCNNMVYSEDFKRPIYEYMPGKVGGHCLNENLDLINNDIVRIINDYIQTGHTQG